MTIGSEETQVHRSDFEVAWESMFPHTPLPPQNKLKSQLEEIVSLFTTNRPTADRIAVLKEEGFLNKIDLTPDLLQRLAILFKDRSVEPYERLFGNNLIRQLLAENEHFGGAIKLNFFGKDTITESRQRKKGVTVLKDVHNFRMTAIGVLNDQNVPTAFILHYPGSGGVKEFTPLVKAAIPMKV